MTLEEWVEQTLARVIESRRRELFSGLQAGECTGLPSGKHKLIRCLTPAHYNHSPASLHCCARTGCTSS